jgi:hypothetical protein
MVSVECSGHVWYHHPSWNSPLASAVLALLDDGGGEGEAGQSGDGEESLGSHFEQSLLVLLAERT